MDDVINKGIAGTVLSTAGDSMLVLCGDGALKITSFLYHGKIVNAKEMILKYNVREGVVLQ